MRNRTIRELYRDWLRGRRYSNLVDITCDEWCAWWRMTGAFEERGTGRYQYYMSRIDKTQPFRLDNIELKQRRRTK